MVPRTDNPNSTWYCCNGRTELGADVCSVTSVRRELIDTAVYSYFEQVRLDVEATRHQLAEARDRKLSEVHALRVEAERDAQRAADRLARVRRSGCRTRSGSLCTSSIAMPLGQA
jgi:hypothetical protein